MRLLLSFLLLLGLCCGAVANAGVATLTGMVVTGINPAAGNVVGRGEPLGGVEVEVEGTEFKAVSSANGFFQFQDLPDGEYQLVAHKPGYPTVKQKVRVNYLGLSSRCQILLNPANATYVPGTAVLPGDLFVAYSRKPNNVNDMESSPYKLLWQMVMAAGGTIHPRPEDLPHQPGGMGSSYLMNPISGEENCLMIFPFASPSRSGFLPLKTRPYWLAFDASGSFLYVAGEGSVLQVLDARQSYKLVRNIPMKGPITDLRLSRDKRYLTVCLMGNTPGVALVDTATTLPAGFVPTETSPWSACLVGPRVFACEGDARSGFVEAVDAASGRQVGKCRVGNCPTGLQETPDGTRLAVACSGNACVSLVDTLNLKELGRVAVDVLPQKLAISPDGSRCLVSNKENNTVTVIDMKLGQPVGTIEVGKAPLGICYSRDGRHAYVACRDSGVIMVLDGQTGQVLHTTIPLPHAVPTGVTIHP